MGSATTPADGSQADRLAAALAHAGADPFVAIVSATRTAVTISDARRPDQPIIFVNDSFCRLTGYDADAVVGRNCRFLQGPATDPAAVAAVRAALAAGEPIEVDLLNYRRDGSPFWNRLAIAPVFDADRAITFFFASQTDVTDERDRLAALESDRDALASAVVDRGAALRASDERLRRAAEAARVGVWEIALPDRTLTATPTLNAVYGFAPDVVPTVAAIRAITHADDAPRAFDRFDAAVTGRSGTDYRTTYRIHRPDGTTAWVEARGEVIVGPDGSPIRIVGVSQDVTERREAEARLELNEESLRLATDAAGVGTWDLDLTTDVLTWSDRTKAMFGISPGVPCSMADFYAGLHPDDVATTGDAFAAALDPVRRAPYDVEYRTIGREDGVVRWVAARGKGLFDGDRCVRAIGSVIDVTGRRAEADALRASETRLAASEAFATLLLDSTSEAFYSIDPTGVTTSCNPAFVAMIGFADAQDAIGRRLHDVIHHSHPDGSHYAVDDCPIYRAASTGRPAHVLDEVFHRLDGTIVPVEYRAEPIWRDGVLCGAICTITDITVRRAAEAERAASEARLRAVIEAAPIGLIFADSGGTILGGNAQVEQLLRHPILASRDAREYAEYVAFHPDGRQVAGDEYPLARALAGEDRPELETLYRRGDGTNAWLRFIAAPIRGAGGAIGGAVVASLDIDAERRAELALRELNATLEQRVAEATAAREAIWRESRDMLLVITLDGMIEAVNPAWTETLGYAADELVGHGFAEFVVADDLTASNAVLAGVPDAPLRGFENRYRHKDGSVRDFAWTAAEANGKIYCVARDVTAEKTAARELEVAQEALRQAQKMEAVGQLTGGIAHDFNNMLAVVLGSLDLLGRRLSSDDVRARRYVDAATDGARRAATLTQRLLAFSRQQPLQPEPVDVNRLVAGMSDLLRGSLGGGVQLETVLAGGLWAVNADPNQLENVILNLGINARDAMGGEGRVTIETACAHLDDRYVAAEIGVAAGQYVLIAVTDAGAGMPPDVIAKAFDPFFTTKSVGKGTGLGLSQVYGFVKQSGGHVKIYSEVGVGTTVKLYLPRLVGAHLAAPDAGTAAAAAVGGDAELILVVDDEAAVRAVTVESLRDLGYRVIDADGAAAALDLLDAHPDVALLFTDIVMPEVNGARLAEAARARRPGLKVLFTTGYTRNAVVHNGVVDSGVELIGKPFTFEALAAKVRSVLDGT